MNLIVNTNHIHPDGNHIEHFDLAFVGAGLSSTWTLISYLDHIRTQQPSFVSKILIVEKSTDIFKGIAYGDRSSDSTLIINSLGDFLPQPELSKFEDWIKSNIEWLFDRFRECDGSYTRGWLEKHASKIVSRDLSLLYIPRYIFGLYLEHRANEAIKECEELGLLQARKLQAQITDVAAELDNFRIHARHCNGAVTLFSSAKVILGLGSPPGRKLLRQQAASPHTGSLVNNPFESGINGMLASVYDQLDQTEIERNNLMVIGSNASAVDVICNLVNHKDCARLINRIHIMSPSGELPHRFSETPVTYPDYQPQNLLNLVNNKNLSANDIYSAVKHDMSVAQVAGIPVAVTIPVISQNVGRLIKQLSATQLRQFVSHTGNAIGKLQRRAGDDYSDILDDLVQQRQLDVMRGEFLDYGGNIPGPLSIEYRDEDGQIQTMDDIKSIINCSGADTLAPDCQDSLLQNLLKRKICEVNDSGRGFKLTDTLETNQPGVYVVGPMIAGNIIGDVPVWHMEHCGRIMQFAERLGCYLAIDRIATVDAIESSTIASVAD